MSSLGFRICFYVSLLVWIIVSISGENIEIVTPENTKPVTAEPENVTNVTNDSYLIAYEEVHRMRSRPIKRNDYEMQEAPKPGSYNTVIRSTFLSDDRYPPLTDEWVPARPTSPPAVYGPPHSHSHSHHYHEVVPPTQSCHQIPYSSPSKDYFGFLPKKLSLKILLKIILKLVLFKMIVKFIAIICLLLFIPLLKSKETHSANDDDMRRMKSLDMMSDYIWNGIDEKDALYDGDEEMSDLRQIVKEDEDDDNDNNNIFSRPTKAIRFLEFCVSAVDRVVGYFLGAVKNRREKDGDDLASFVLEKIKNFVKSMAE